MHNPLYPFNLSFPLIRQILCLLFTGALLFAAPPIATAQNTAYQPDAACSEVADQNYPEYHECFSAIEKKAIAAAPSGQVKRHDDTLCIHPQSSKPICFTNQERDYQKDLDLEHYYYLGTPPNLDQVALIVNKTSNMDTDDTGLYLLISLKNGQLLAHMPTTAQQLAFSPDGRFLAGYDNNIVQYPPALKIWQIDHSPAPKEWNVVLHLLNPIALTGHMDIYDAELSWANNAFQLYSPEHHNKLSITPVCNDDYLFYAGQAQITDEGLEFNWSENCAQVSWSLHL